LTKWTIERREAAKRYTSLLQNLPVVLPNDLPDRTHVYHLYVIRVKEREKFMKFLSREGVQTSIHYPVPVHKQVAYKDIPKRKLPISEKVAKEVVSLPFFVGITPQEQEYVAGRITQFFRK
jgi:dTDP-4-amino-4,6-dideoxygalactose transaminase